MMTDEELDNRISEELDNRIRESFVAAAENDFVREVYEHDMKDPMEILNWYRNLYYKEGWRHLSGPCIEQKVHP